MNVSDWERTLRDNLNALRDRIADAGKRAGRNTDDVRLVAVTKYVTEDVLRALLRFGIVDIGESRVQQLVNRATALQTEPLQWDQPRPANAPLQPRWHMIGHLQRNKVKALLPYTHIIQSVDSIRLVQTLARQAEAADAHLDILLEVNVSGEKSKQGLDPQNLGPVIDAVNAEPKLTLRGLMTMAPFDPKPENARPTFRGLAQLLYKLRDTGAVHDDCHELSMGMTNDFEVAVQEGATVIRVGSALFENLPPDLRLKK